MTIWTVVVGLLAVAVLVGVVLWPMPDRHDDSHPPEHML
jgi:hypothetical protein